MTLPSQPVDIITYLATATTEDGDVISYEYNKDGIRTSKTINGTTTTYKLHESEIVKEITGNTEKWYLYDENSELLGISINGVSYYYDEEIGLYYLQSRYYDSEVGRFINGDDVNVMISLQSGVKGANLFEYCENNVVNRQDSEGYL